MSWWLVALIACGTPAAPEPPPAEPVAEPEPEPAKKEQVVTLSIGRQCAEPLPGEPADQAEVEARLTKAGIAYSKIEPMMVCEACDTCPKMSFLITTPATEQAVLALFAPKVDKGDLPPGTVAIRVGTKCSDPLEGAPTNAEAVLAALEAAGVTVASHEEMMVCQACGCPAFAVMVQVAPEDLPKVAELSAPWAPVKPESPPKTKLKGSLP